MSDKPVQHLYADELSHCYGCGRNNPHGLHVQSRWDGTEAKARFTPRPEHIAVPGYVYGGLLASLVDCHGVATAAAAAGMELAGDEPLGRFVTASLNVVFVKPTPLGVELELRARVTERRRRKLVVAVEILAEGEVRVRGEVVAAPMPTSMEMK
ncbi:Thioesterase superfamily protein [Desulfonatronum thiosulfatophilum]|uniref:Thioesterase superfamily protein n=1 Tax=Desulfonatronum thiosulfatophilum TaxID=617002 RepID=A0A1G6E2D0_9BACT|nr:hotdog domain-containing protein [Desulfonatronum thiosulfatophilum]SDB51607.1 Thioesterase superfamily protein [Desulfonatronum thiosulfatophilum]